MTSSLELQASIFFLKNKLKTVNQLASLLARLG